MNNANLVPITPLSHEEAVKQGRKGGKVKSTKKRYAARLREMKRTNSVSAKWFLARLEDPECNAFDIMDFIDRLEKHAVEAKQFGMLKDVAELKIKFLKAHHGDKQKIETTGINSVTFVLNRPEGSTGEIDFENKEVIDAEFSTVESDENVRPAGGQKQDTVQISEDND